MTTMAEQVEQEQEEHEAAQEEEQAEFEEGEQAEEEEAAPEPEQAFAGIGEPEIRRAERAILAQRKKIAGILGEEAVAHDCILCAGLGFLPELPPLGTEFAYVATDSGPTLLAREPEPAPEFVQAPDKAACDWCEAYGFVRSGSKNPNAAVVPCSKCQGNGWVMVAIETPPAAQAPAMAPAAGPAGIEGVPGVGLDTWGRPPGHLHWGVPPAMVKAY